MSEPHIYGKIRHPGPAPIEHAGQWVAWNGSQSEIIAHGKTLAEVRAAVAAAGSPKVIYQKVRRPGIFIGAL